MVGDSSCPCEHKGKAGGGAAGSTTSGKAILVPTCREGFFHKSRGSAEPRGAASTPRRSAAWAGRRLMDWPDVNRTREAETVASGFWPSSGLLSNRTGNISTIPLNYSPHAQSLCKKKRRARRSRPTRWADGNRNAKAAGTQRRSPSLREIQRHSAEATESSKGERVPLCRAELCVPSSKRTGRSRSGSRRLSLRNTHAEGAEASLTQ